METIEIFFKDRLNREFSLNSKIGLTLSEFLNLQNIPLNAVICRNKGKIITENHIINEDDFLEIEMVRFYDLPRILNQNMKIKTVDEPIYSKSFVSFNKGNVESSLLP